MNTTTHDTRPRVRPLARILTALVTTGMLVMVTAPTANAGTIRTHTYGKNYYSCAHQTGLQSAKYIRQYHNARIAVICKRLAHGGDWRYGSEWRLGARK